MLSSQAPEVPYNLIAGIQEKCKAARIAIHRLKVNNAAVTPKHSVVLTLDRKLGVSSDMTRFAHSHRGIRWLLPSSLPQKDR